MAASSDRFKQAEDEYFRLRGQLAAGRISQEQFETALKSLMVQDAQGRYWMLGVDTSKWYVNQGNAWVEADPYAQNASAPPALTLPESTIPFTPPPTRRAAVSPPPVAPPPTMAPPIATPASATQRKGGCGGCFLRGCAAIIIVLVVIGVGGFVAYQSGALTLDNLLRLAGLGPARLEVNNFRDDAIIVNIEQQRTSQDSSSFSNQLELNAFDVRSLQLQNPGRYSVAFQTNSGTKLGSCTLTVRGGDSYQFVTLPERTVVNRANSPSQRGADFTIGTSSLCQ